MNNLSKFFARKTAFAFLLLPALGLASCAKDDVAPAPTAPTATAQEHDAVSGISLVGVSGRNITVSFNSSTAGTLTVTATPAGNGAVGGTSSPKTVKKGFNQVSIFANSSGSWRVTAGGQSVTARVK